jgi:preprotein translocase subunit YajC
MLAAKSGSSAILIIYVVVFGALYFFYLRPRSKKQKAQRTEARKVEVGDRAQTIGGLLGTVTKNDGTTVTLRTASGVELEFVAQAIARKVDSTPATGEAQA